MRYGLGTNLADFGFAFLEKIHEPIFLINRLGRVVKVNEAGRKLLKIAGVGERDRDALSAQVGQMFSAARDNGYRRLKLRDGLSLVARSLANSEFILVEVRR